MSGIEPDRLGERTTSRDPLFRDNPHLVYDELRSAGCPVHDPTYGRFIVTSHQTARTVIRHKDFGVDARRASGDSYMRKVAGTGVLEGKGNNSYEPPLVLLDDPAHRRIRLLVSKAFNARRIEDEGPRIERITERLLRRLDGFDPVDRVDLVSEFVSLLPAQVIAEILGLEGGDVGTLRTWSEDILWGYDPHRDITRQERLRTAYEGLVSLIKGTVQLRRSKPADDLISEMVRASQNDDRLDDLEIISLCVQLMVAGNVTTSDLMGNGLYWLAGHPDQRSRLAADPSLMPGAVEEMLRYDCPITETARIAQCDLDLDGVALQAGDTITVSLAAANHDPAVFEDPHRFDIERDASGHLGFGSGVHVCLGAPLARLEASIGLGRFLARYPDYEIVEDGLRRRALPFFRGFELLPVMLGRRSGG
ncbi:MAG: cytochrome P450 [Acidimicrobiales bacterium]